MNSIITNYWKQKASRWNDSYTWFSPTTFFLLRRQVVLAKIIKQFRHKRVLDIGCGNGVFMAEIIRQQGYVVGLDYSRDMLAIAGKKLQSFPSQSYKLIYGTATQLPFRASFFDVLLASGLTDYLNKKDNKKFLTEASRVVKKRGVVVITFPKELSPFTFLRSGFGLWLRDKLLFLPPILSSFEKEEIEKMMRDAGFIITNWHTILGTMWIVEGMKQ